mgnify:CR=1 FL=1
MDQDDERLDRLEELLQALPVENEPMTVSELDGFVTGLLACPEMIPPSDWLSQVWGVTGDAQFPDLATAQGNRRITVNAARRLDAPFKLPPGLYRVGAKAIGVCGDKMAVQITDWMGAPSMQHLSTAAAGALVQLALVAATLALWLGAERVLAPLIPVLAAAGGAFFLLKKNAAEAEEDVDGTDHNKYLWMNAAYALGTRVTDAFARYGWCVAIRGVEGGGVPARNSGAICAPSSVGRWGGRRTNRSPNQPQRRPRPSAAIGRSWPAGWG